MTNFIFVGSKITPIGECSDGQRYRIDLVQVVEGVYPPSVDLSLVLWEQRREEAACELV